MKAACTGKYTISDLPVFLKWAGGKSQLLDQFKSMFPRHFENYHEPFIGSGAVFFYVKSRLAPKKISLSDLNEELINCYTVVRDNVSELVESLANHKSHHSKEYYYSVRSVDIHKLTNVERASRLIYLNKTCFNGLYRVNSSGQFNVPFGDYKNPKIFDNETLLRASDLLQDVELLVMHFSKVIGFADKKDLVYFDPPYMPISKTSNFTSYSKEEFSAKEQERLADTFKVLDSRGCYVMLSNSDHPFVRELYRDYEKNTVVVRAKRMINSVGSRRGAINELVIRNYDCMKPEAFMMHSKQIPSAK